MAAKARKLKSKKNPMSKEEGLYFLMKFFTEVRSNFSDRAINLR